MSGIGVVIGRTHSMNQARCRTVQGPQPGSDFQDRRANRAGVESALSQGEAACRGRQRGPGLLEAASFILLDWRLWPAGADELERAGVASNIRFLEQAKDYFVPVFIFTNEAARRHHGESAGVRLSGAVA